MSKCYASTVIAVAEGEIGYKEKASNANLGDKTANAGTANYTKYARDFDQKFPNWYNGKKNGFAWCDVFVDWCFLTAFGYAKALELLCQPKKSAGAGCTYSYGYYKKKGQAGKTPKVGAQIFFGTSESNCSHTGIVYAFDASKVYTIEGNTSNQVAKKSYARTDSKIVGYGYPNYDAETGASTPTATKSVDELAKEVLAGKWGNGDDRKNALTAAGYNYSEVQAKVNALVAGSSGSTSAVTPVPAVTFGKTITVDAKAIWSFLIGKIGNPYGVAGLMGNLYAESALSAINLQNSYEKSLGYTDAAYTDAVDNGSYTNFVRDSAGYGLAQWTYWSRKQALLTYCQSKKASIGNLTAQLEFLYKELSESYSGVLTTLKNAKSVLEASNAVLTKYERPANQGASVQSARASYGQKYYDQYAGSGSSGTQAVIPPVSTPAASKPQGVTVEYAQSKESGHGSGKDFKTTATLNMRTGAGTNKTVIKVLAQGAKVTWYGYYTLVSGVKWYLVVDSTGQTGFVSYQYLV